jgi:hypothetical protein
MPAKPKARKRKVRVGIKAKRAAITRAYGRYNPCGDEDFFYSRRHLTKTRPDKNGLRELKYQAEACDLQEAMEETFQRIRDRDGVKYFTEAADGLLREIAFEINYHAGPKAMHREMAKLDNDYPPPYPRGEAAMRRPGRAAARIQNSV